MNPSITHGAISWSELMTADPEAAVRFYGAVLGWKDDVMPMPQGNYHVQMLDDRPVGGIMALPEPDVPTVWVYYMTVDDVDAVASRAVELGGKIEVPAMDIPSVGRFCGLLDPQGAFFHIIKYEEMEGEDMPEVDFTKSFVTPGAFSWFQLQTKDAEAATAFYRSLLGWEVVEEQMPMGPYRTIKVGGVGIGGIMKVWEEGMPPHWGSYVTVDDIEAVTAAASSAGGTVLVPPSEIPSVGRFSTVQDPTGGVLNFVEYLPMGEQS